MLLIGDFYDNKALEIDFSTELSFKTSMFNHYDSNLMDAYPISQIIKNPSENNKQLIQPIGERILIEEKTPVMKYLYTSGYHQAKKAQKANEPNSTMAERIESAKAKKTNLIILKSASNSFQNK